MELGTIFRQDEYSEAYKYAQANRYMIIRVGIGRYQIVEKTVIIQTIEEQNEAIRATREQLYQQTSDKLKADYDEAVARGSEDAEELKQAWLESKDKIREENPYVVEEVEPIEETKEHEEVIEDGLQREEKEVEGIAVKEYNKW